MPKPTGITAKLQCLHCGRDFTGDETLKQGDPCPSDDCPSHWELVGRTWNCDHVINQSK